MKGDKGEAGLPGFDGVGEKVSVLSLPFRVGYVHIVRDLRLNAVQVMPSTSQVQHTFRLRLIMVNYGQFDIRSLYSTFLESLYL